MAIKEILMPNLGESVTEASVTSWLVKPGDKVDRYDPLMEVVSDKVTTEIPSDFAGEIKEYLVDVDVDVPIGTKLMTLQADGESGTVANEMVQVAPTPTATKAEVQVKDVKPKGDQRSAGRYSPAVMRLAQEKNIELTQVVGSGKGGRITRKDIMAFDPGNQAPSEQIVAEEAAAARPVAPATITTPLVVPQGSEAVPADGVRKAIAKKMTQSATEIPHAWIMVEADVTNIVKLRNEVKDDFKQKEGYSLSFFPFFVKAVVQALKKNPKINTSWDDGTIIYHNDINMSIAITTDEHLYVPVIQQADNYSLSGLAKEINRLASNVRTGELSNQDMQGGTFTVNNTGSIGAVQSMGIINHPQAAILQVESIVKRVVPTTDGGIKVADMVNLSLSIDHRILDGQQAGKFLKDIKENLGRFANEGDIY